VFLDVYSTRKGFRIKVLCGPETTNSELEITLKDTTTMLFPRIHGFSLPSSFSALSLNFTTSQIMHEKQFMKFPEEMPFTNCTSKPCHE
jgi:hypothetical protein